MAPKDPKDTPVRGIPDATWARDLSCLCDCACARASVLADSVRACNLTWTSGGFILLACSSCFSLGAEPDQGEGNKEEEGEEEREQHRLPPA